MNARTSPLLVLILSAATAFGQTPVLIRVAESQPAATSRAAPGPKVTKMTVRPKAAPEPALKYLLLPSLVDQTPGDAMTLYYTAMENIPSSQELNDNIAKWLSVPAKDLPVAEARRAVDSYRTMLGQVELAARREHCQWELPIRAQGFSLILPPLSKYRQLAKALALRIRLEIIDGEWDKAVHDLQTGYAMARHVAECPVLIGGLVGIAIAGIMSNQVAELLQAPNAPNLYWALTDLPTPLIDLRRAWQYEREVLYLSYPRLREMREGKLTTAQWQGVAEELGKALSLVGEMEAQHGPDGRAILAVYSMKLYPAGKKYLIDKGMPPEQVEKMPVAQVVAAYSLEGYERVRDENFKWFGVPYWQAHEGMHRAEKGVGQALQKGEGWPFTALLPTLGRACFLAARNDRQVAALRTIEAVRIYASGHEGKLPAALEDITDVPLPIDPVTGKPFKYSVSGNRFVLDAYALSGQYPGDADRYEVTVTK